MAASIIIDGLSVDVERPATATRPTMLFVHGINVGAWTFANYMRWFAARGHPCYALDLRGHYASRAVDDLGRVTIAEYADDVITVARAIAAGPERPGGNPINAPLILAGHSMGGLIAQKAAESLDLAALVLLAPAPGRGIPILSLPLLMRMTKYVGRMVRPAPLMSTFGDVGALVLNGVPRERHAAIYARFVPESGRAAREMALGTVRVDRAKVRGPVLVVTGLRDRTIPPGIARRVAAFHDADLLEYAEHAHFLVDEPGWEELAADIARWLERAVPLR